MEGGKIFECPQCHQPVSLPESFDAPTVVCSGCWHEFSAAAGPDTTTQLPDIVLPTKLPFFKSGRKKILLEKLHELTADGELSDSDEALLGQAALRLGLKQEDLNEIEKAEFFAEFAPIQQRMEKSWYYTDEDANEIETLKRKYGVRNFTLEGTASLFRAIYLLEVKGQLPAVISTGLMLGSNEQAYYLIPTTWHQVRVRNHGYSGTSFSVPTGLKGVRFRFGGYTPVKSEEVTPLATGTLVVTSQRLLFNGDTRNTTITLKKVIDGHVFTDSVKIEKSTGKADYFSMNGAEARYVLALIGALRS
jgi:hypothetical protein